MYAVIFRAEIAELDDTYHRMAERLHRIAVEEFGCRGIDGYQEGDREITVTWWDSEEEIRRWRDHPLHREAQALGRARWYRAYSVEVAEVTRRYEYPADAGRRM